MTGDWAKTPAPHAVLAKDSRSGWRKSAAKWRRRSPVLEVLESRRLLSVNVAEFPIRVQGGNPQGVASGAGTDTNIWFTLSSSNIGMINPSNTSAGVTQYPIPTYNSGPGPIAAGPDGNYWFFEKYCQSVRRHQPDHRPHHRDLPAERADPQVDGITAGPNGTVWFTVFNTQPDRRDQHDHRPDLALSRDHPRRRSRTGSSRARTAISGLPRRARTRSV